MEKLLLTANEAGELIGAGRSKIYAMVKEGELPSVRVGSLIRIPAEDLRRWVQQKAREQQARQRA